jgi:CubicO group peptidase (beta-lactamase class C family)
VMARGYGLADVEARQPVMPDSLFRIGSISKCLTMIGVLKLVEEGRLDLEARAFELLGYPPAPGVKVEPRLASITVRNLLTHTGGWDRDRSGDITASHYNYAAARAFRVPTPATAEQLIRYNLGARLDFEPGSSYAYSNFGFLVLGRVIEKVSGQKYEDFIREHVLQPLGIARMRLGRSLRSQRSAGEVRYYEPPGSPLVRSIYSKVPVLVPLAYGGFAMEAMDSQGGWIASPVDLLRFASMVEGSRGGVLRPETLAIVFQRPPYSYFDGLPWWYFGLSVQPYNGGFGFGHNGRTSADYSVLARRADGVAWAVSVNGSTTLTAFAGGGAMSVMAGELNSGLDAAANAVAAWPEHDLFERYF